MSKTRELLHPIHRVPAVADVVGYYLDPVTSRNIGEELQFCDGHRCKLTYAEIQDLQVETAVSEEVI